MDRGFRALVGTTGKVGVIIANSGGFFNRIGQFFRDLFTPEPEPPQPPEPEYEPDYGDVEPTETGVEPVPYGYDEPEAPAYEPPSTTYDYSYEYGDNIYGDMADDLGITDDAYAMDLLYTGWFDPEADFDQRREAREFFFEYTDWDEGEFPWDDWREWYENAS